MSLCKDKCDKELVNLLSEGSEHAFCELYSRYKIRLVHFCISFLKDKITAEDVVQDIFTHIWESHQFINPNYSFSSYLFTIAKNRIINILKKLDAESELREKILKIREESSDICDTDFDLLNTEYESLLDEAIERLSPMKRKVFLLSRKEHKSHKEIAEMLQISVYTVQEYMSESIQLIKLYLSKKTDISFAIFILFYLGYLTI